MTSHSHSPSTIDLIDTALITGGGGGIGKALAKHLISHGKKVIIAGRTESTLKSTADEIGAKAYYVLDTGDIASIAPFVKILVENHPDLNCLINNAGVQRPFQFPGSGGTDYTFDLAKADQEIDINVRGPMHLCVELLPHLTSLPNEKKGVIINVTSSLAFHPASIINPCYNGTKAFLHNFTQNMRSQFAANNKVKVVEIAPPQVETDLHRDRVDPDDNKKGRSQVALSLEEFMDEVDQGLREGADIISAGPGKKFVQMWRDGLGAAYDEATKAKGSF